MWIEHVYIIIKYIVIVFIGGIHVPYLMQLGILIYSNKSLAFTNFNFLCCKYLYSGVRFFFFSNWLFYQVQIGKNQIVSVLIYGKQFWYCKKKIHSLQKVIDKVATKIVFMLKCNSRLASSGNGRLFVGNFHTIHLKLNKINLYFHENQIFIKSSSEVFQWRKGDGKLKNSMNFPIKSWTMKKEKNVIK